MCSSYSVYCVDRLLRQSSRTNTAVLCRLWEKIVECWRVFITSQFDFTFRKLSCRIQFCVKLKNCFDDQCHWFCASIRKMFSARAFEWSENKIWLRVRMQNARMTASVYVSSRNAAYTNNVHVLILKPTLTLHHEWCFAAAIEYDYIL